MSPLARTAINFVAFQAAWLACVLGAGRGLPWAGVAAAAAAVALHLALARDRRLELVLLGCAVALGVVVDSGLDAAGAMAYAAKPWASPLAAPWILALWAAFATTFTGCFAWVVGRPLLGALVGGLGGPLSYRAGEALGAVQVAPHGRWGWAWVAVAWAIALPVLGSVAARGRRGLSRRP